MKTGRKRTLLAAVEVFVPPDVEPEHVTAAMLESIEKLSPKRRAEVEMLLDLLNAPMRLPLGARSRILGAMAGSPVAQLRSGFATLKRLSLFTAYSDGAASGENRTWQRIGYPGPRDDRSKQQTLPALAWARADETLDADVVVIGSGAGGGVAATPANENNEFGVAKLLLGLDGNVAALVVELGARHFGEIEPLARAVLPDLAILTNIGDAHLEIMGSPERLAETKWGIFATGALPVLNGDDVVSRRRATMLERQPEWFAARASDASPHEFGGMRQTIVIGRDRLVVHEPSATRSFDITCDLPGDHNLSNLAAAAAGALALGVKAERVAESIAGLTLPEGRYDRTAIGDFEVIYDAYNASMSGTLATLGSFAREPAARRVAVLGGMAELGADAASMHERVGAAAAAAGLALLLVGGDFVAEL